MGNMHFTTLATSKEAKHDGILKDSYKFFYHVLNEDRKNVYAANGLAMVCAEKGELDAARDIFTRVNTLILMSSYSSIDNKNFCFRQEKLMA